jgi:hypothetical protein
MTKNNTNQADVQQEYERERERDSYPLSKMSKERHLHEFLNNTFEE